MPKMKTNTGAAKRFKFSATGKIKRGSAFRRHILTSKTTKRKRQLRGDAFVAEVDMYGIKRMMPYGK